jgi:hypothetical protein
MDLDHDACYRAIAVRDARFDGRLFTRCQNDRDLLPSDLSRTNTALGKRRLLSNRRRGAGGWIQAVFALPPGDRPRSRRLAWRIKHCLAGAFAHRDGGVGRCER